MAIIPVQVGRNTLGDVLVDGGSKFNIIIDDLYKHLGLPSPKPTPYDLQMANQSTTKLVGLIKDVQIKIHGIPYTITFTMMNNSIVDDSYCCWADPSCAL